MKNGVVTDLIKHAIVIECQLNCGRKNNVQFLWFQTCRQKILFKKNTLYVVFSYFDTNFLLRNGSEETDAIDQ